MISTLTTSLWVEPYILYKHGLKMSSVDHFLHYAFYAGITFLLWFGEDKLCQQITGNFWLVGIARLTLCFGLTNLAYLLLYHRTREFRLMMRKARELLRKIFSFYLRWKGAK